MELSFQRQVFHQEPLVSLPSPIHLPDQFYDYSIDIINHDINSIDPTIEMHELPSSDIIIQDTLMKYVYTTITRCDEFLFYNNDHCDEAKLWNPWLRQVKCIKPKDKKFYVVGLGYSNSRPEKVYKILGYIYCPQCRFVIYECASYALKFTNTLVQDCPLTTSDSLSIVSLNGNLYWVTQISKFIQIFDFSTENFKPFCLLPCQKNHHRDELILAVYKGDRFSLLKQCYETRKIEIWVMEKNIDREEKEVVWINFMTLPTTNLPTLFGKFGRISYFLYDKTLFMCCGDDETITAYIYIVREDLCKKIQIGSGIANCCHCVYTPNLISLPLEI